MVWRTGGESEELPNLCEAVARPVIAGAVALLVDVFEAPVAEEGRAAAPLLARIKRRVVTSLRRQLTVAVAMRGGVGFPDGEVLQLRVPEQREEQLADVGRDGAKLPLQRRGLRLADDKRPVREARQRLLRRRGDDGRELRGRGGFAVRDGVDRWAAARPRD